MTDPEHPAVDDTFTLKDVRTHSREIDALAGHVASFASHEISGMNEWQIHDGQVSITPADDRYRYLDA